MKSTASVPNAGHFDKATASDQKGSKTPRTHYALMVLLAVIAYLLSTWVASTPGTFSAGIGSGFALFWLGGGLITLILLTFAAKR